MKKSFIAMLLVFALCVGCLVSAHANLNGTKEDVVLTETVLAGDRSAANGLLVETEIESAARELIWNTNVLFRDGISYDTTFTLYPDGQPYEYQVTTYGLHLYSGLDSWYYSLDEYDTITDPYYKSLLEPVMDVASRTAPGESREETIYLADYFTYYPVDVEGSMINAYTASETEAWQSAFREFFRFPVEPDDTMSISVDKDSQGRIYSWGGSEGEDYLYVSLYGESTASDSVVYFSVDIEVLGNDDGDTRYLDTSLLPGGYGIFMVPYTDDKPLTDGLCTFYSLEETSVVRNLRMSGDDRHLLLQTVEPDGYHFYVIDADTAETLQHIKLSDGETYGYLEYHDGFALWYFDDYNAVTVLEEQDDGLYEQVFTADLTPLDEHDCTVTGEAAWDGERLALTNHLVEKVLDSRGLVYHASRCGFYTAVYTAEGLQFLGTYDSSLDMEPANPWYPLTTPEYYYYERFPKVSWVG